jgi:hypothetical protein
MGKEVLDKQELKERWRKAWLFALFTLTHLEFQKKLWIDASFDDIISSYCEDMCQYFDDLFLDNGYEYHINNGYISVGEYNTIKDFHNLLSGYDEGSKSDKEIVYDNSWIEIVKVGYHSWIDLKGIIKESKEIEFIDEFENKYLRVNAS